MSEKPVFTARGGGGVRASVWANQGEGDQTFLTTAISRNYRDNNGDWQTTNTYLPHQLPQLILAAIDAFVYTQVGRGLFREQQQPEWDTKEGAASQQEHGTENPPPEAPQSGELAGIENADARKASPIR